jgi:signal transduction histidine kinase
MLWSASAMTLLAVAEVLRAADSVVPGSLLLQTAGFTVIAAALLVASAATELCEIYASQGTRELSLFGGLSAATRKLHLVEQEQSERLHDARSAILGVLGASHLLTEPAIAAGQEALHRLMLAELSRLSCVLDPEQPDPIEVFVLAEALEPVLTAHRLEGAELHASGLEVGVRARRSATATVLANVLGNARLHAAGSLVWLGASVRNGIVTITVDDDGSGISAAELNRLGRRGQRGSEVRAPGSGLGLFTSIRAMADQGGLLSLGPSAYGGLQVRLELPAAAAAEPGVREAC